MRPTIVRFLVTLCLVCAGYSPHPARATDVDGPDDCTRPAAPVDFGDAPEGVLAYPGVTGQFPSCIATSALLGTRTFVCPPISTAPGPTGYVRHVHPGTDRYWLGCPPVGNPPMGIDGESDAKVNDNGSAISACNGAVGVDCIETAGILNFGQDEGYGSSDAALAAPITLTACGPGNVGWTIAAFSCAAVSRTAYLNILADWNRDGDWNDNFNCASGCAFEWPVKNFLVTLAPGCNTIFVPTFRVGPNPGDGWMRITLSDEQAPDDFPWNGSVGTPTQSLHNGETEDYPVVILPSMIGECLDYEDWGDAPEEARAYPGVPGRFPTCSGPGIPGTQELACVPALSTPPGPTGFVKHLASANDEFGFWLGCSTAGTLAVDSETDGKTNDTGALASMCSTNLLVDCTELSGLVWGQDECYGDGVDAGVDLPWISFNACRPGTVDFSTFNCKTLPREVFLNVLVDMNADGDWNDNFACAGAGCAYEWAVKNRLIPLAPGCEKHTSPAFLVGPHVGQGWVRITLTATPVSDDFPWDGSAGPTGDLFFRGGETEDYLAVIRPQNVGAEDPARTERFFLAAPAPNPARDEVLLRFTLAKDEDVSLAVFDLAGRKLAQLAQGRRPAGEHHATWNFRDANGREFGAGFYVVQLRVGDRVLKQSGVRVR